MTEFLTPSFFLKLIICQLVLMSWYWFALRDRAHHQFNRFYLLAILPVSWLIPTLKFNWIQTGLPVSVRPAFLKVLETSGRPEFAEAPVGSATDWWGFVLSLAVTVSALLILRTLLIFIRRWMRASSMKSVESGRARFVVNGSSSSPYSFLNFIFWNDQIPMNSEAGWQIIRHEMVHIRQKHSIDKLLMHVFVAINWFNPLAWFAARELNVIHEYLADEGSVERGNTRSLAEMLLTAGFGNHAKLFTQSFYQSPIKRRLNMITRTFASRNLLARLAVVPFFGLLLFMFSFRNGSNSLALDKPYTVVLDAGHGGEDKGAQGINNISESGLALDLTKKVQKVLEQQGVKVVLTRTDDQAVKLQDRLAAVEREKADVFVSVHANASADKATDNGFEIVLPSRNMQFETQNRELAAHITGALGSLFNNKVSVQRRNTGIFVLDQNKLCPSLLLECGYITNSGDLKIIQEQGDDVAQSIAKGIIAYLAK